MSRRQGQDHPQWRGVGGLGTRFWRKLKYRAHRRGLPCSITMEQAWQLLVDQDFRCALSGRRIELPRSKTGTGTASLDRIDSDKGYALENCQWVHKDFNKLKWDWSQDELLAMCTEVVIHARRKQRPVVITGFRLLNNYTRTRTD